MGPVTSLLTAIERQDVAALTDVIEHNAMHEENLTYEEAVALWDVGWQEWNAGDRTGHISWQAMLRQIGFPATDRMIGDCRSANEENLARLDYSGLITLAEELDMFEMHRGLESFAREGLMR